MPQTERLSLRRIFTARLELKNNLNGKPPALPGVSDNARFIAPANLADANGWNNNWTTQVPEDRKFVEVEPMNQKNDFFKVSQIISRLIQKNLHPLLMRSFNRDFLSLFISANNLVSIPNVREAAEIISQYAIVQHMHSHAKLSESAWREIIANSDGMNNDFNNESIFNAYMAFKWFTKELGQDLEKGTNYKLVHKDWIVSVFYHPIRFLAYLDEAQSAENQ